jgi:protein O-mannosyl-transferase
MGKTCCYIKNTFKTPIVKPVRIITLICILTIACYSPTFINDFQLGWDDQWQVLDYEYVHNHSFSNLWYHFTHFHRGQYMPVNTVLYIIIYEIFGFNPGAFHAASLIIHTANVLLVFSILNRVLNFTKRSWTENRILLFSAVVALIFAIHPLQVESVAWISASKIPLFAFFTLCGFYLYILYIQTNNLWILSSVAICYLLAFGSKEQAIIFPLNLLAFDYIFNRFKDFSFVLSAFRKQVFVEKIPFIIIAILLYLFSLSNNLGTFTNSSYSLSQRLLFGASSFMDYIFRFIAPVKLYYFYFFPIEPGKSLPVLYWGYLLLVAICALFLYRNYEANNKLVLFGFTFFAINILLVLHIVPMPRKMITADRYMYLSVIGLAIIGGWLIQYYYYKFRTWRKTLLILCGVWLIFSGVHSFFRTTEWKDSDSIKRNINELVEKRKANKDPVVNNPLNDENNGIQ